MFVWGSWYREIKKSSNCFTVYFNCCSRGGVLFNVFSVLS